MTVWVSGAATINSDSREDLLVRRSETFQTQNPKTVSLYLPKHIHTYRFTRAMHPSQAVKTESGSASTANVAMLDHKRLQENLHAFGLKVKEYDNNIEFLEAQRLKLKQSLLDLQAKREGEDHSTFQRDDRITKQILHHENTAAGIYCQIKTNHVDTPQAQFIKDVLLGVVAELGTVEDENLSRILSEYLGLENMLALVCKNHEGVQQLEKYGTDCKIDQDLGIHGVGSLVGKALTGRFSVICLDDLRPYDGQCLPDDPQRKLNLFKPILPNGEFPPGFIGFSVNMINIEAADMFYEAENGFGLRETLFYGLFGRMQVYQTREEMFNARSVILEGAVSLDGGMIRCGGEFSLGSRNEVDVIFSKPSATVNRPDNYLERAKQIKVLKYRDEKLEAELKRVKFMKACARSEFDKKKQEYVTFLSQSSVYTSYNSAPDASSRA